MSITKIRSALEVALSSFDNMQTAWENDSFDPTDGVPYQQVSLLLNDPDNATLGDDYYKQRGILSIRQMFPLGEGSFDAADRADSLRSFFHKGKSVNSGDTIVVIEKTPVIMTGSIEESRYVVAIRFPFYCEVFSQNAITPPSVESVSSFVPGTLPNDGSPVLFIPVDAYDITISSLQGVATVAATALFTLLLQKIDALGAVSTVGSLTWQPGATVATGVMNKTLFPKGSTIYSPSIVTSDNTLANISITLIK